MNHCLLAAGAIIVALCGELRLRPGEGPAWHRRRAGQGTGEPDREAVQDGPVAETVALLDAGARADHRLGPDCAAVAHDRAGFDDAAAADATAVDHRARAELIRQALTPDQLRFAIGYFAQSSPFSKRLTTTSPAINTATIAMSNASSDVLTAVLPGVSTNRIRRTTAISPTTMNGWATRR